MSFFKAVFDASFLSQNNTGSALTWSQIWKKMLKYFSDLSIKLIKNAKVVG